MHEPDESYSGSATIDDACVEVDLKGYFEAIDGKFHWYGRVVGLKAVSGSRVSITTPHGTAEARVSDIDPWGRFRITGTGRPPF